MGAEPPNAEAKWRYRAYRRGLRLVKYRVDSQAYREYGPYALVDQMTNTIVYSRLDADALAHALS